MNRKCEEKAWVSEMEGGTAGWGEKDNSHCKFNLGCARQ